jgi:hypothetical protein
VTFSRKGITSSIPSGPPNETTRIASKNVSGYLVSKPSAGGFR